MTHTTDYLGLCRAIRDNPDDDTPRLMLADYFDGLDTVRIPCPTCSGYADDPCPRCEGRPEQTRFHGPGATNPYSWSCHERKGTGKYPPGYHVQRDPASGRDEGGYTNCQTCNGAGAGTPGFVIDTSNAARAELIRVQIDLAHLFSAPCRSCGKSLETDRVSDGCPCNSPRDVNHGIVPAYVCTCPECDPDSTGSIRARPVEVEILYRRERELLAANADRWRAGPQCEKCKGCGECIGVPNYPCVHCNGTGDAGGLLRRFNVVDEYGAVRGDDLVRVDYVRGMKRIHAALAECAKEYHAYPPGRRGDNDWYVTHHPAPWLRSVLKHHPDVVEVWVTDKRPFGYFDAPDKYGWSRDRPTYSDARENVLPPAIWDLLPGGNIWPSEDAARTALARAVVRWALSFPDPEPED